MFIESLLDKFSHLFLCVKKQNWTRDDTRNKRLAKMHITLNICDL
jgi:hypothetical protein